MNAPASITITPVRVADLLAEGERMPVYVYVIDHPDARVLVDTGMTELHPAVADLESPPPSLEQAGPRSRRHRHRGQHTPALRPLRRQPPLRRQADLRPASGARRRAQRGRLHHSRVGRGAGVRYMPVDGELDLLPGLRLVPAPGHTRGMQVVVVETDHFPLTDP